MPKTFNEWMGRLGLFALGLALMFSGAAFILDALLP